MKKRIIFFTYLLMAIGVDAQTFEDFESSFTGLRFPDDRAMFEYAFQNTDLTANTSGLFQDFYEFPDSIKLIFNTVQNADTMQSENLFQIASIMNHIDVTGEFLVDSLIYPQFDRIYALDGERNYRMPIVLFDTRITRTDWPARQVIENWNSVNPFPAFTAADMIYSDYFFAGLLFDTVSYQNTSIYFDPSAIRSNRTRELLEIQVVAQNSVFVLAPGDEIDISNWSGLIPITLDFIFSDGSIESIVQRFIKSSPTLVPKDAFWSFTDPSNIVYKANLANDNNHISIVNPEIQMAIKYGCEEGKIRRPYLFVAGWGPHSDDPEINSAFGFPSTLNDFGIAINGGQNEIGQYITGSTPGFLEELNQAGFDIILVKFFPPNASIMKNSELLKDAINWVNDRKFSEGSFEENIVQGYSAGALAAKLALLKIENKHLNQPGQPHSHTKLFVSYDGEHQGANIPLGLQSEVMFLDRFTHHNNTVWFNNGNSSPGAGMYALEYVLNAPLSRELLHYFHTETGSAYSAQGFGQGPHPDRNAYLNWQAAENHIKNTHIPNYPSFGRNISIANGTSTPNYEFSNFSSDHYPYPAETHHQFYYQLTPLDKQDIHFLSHGVSSVFYYGRKFHTWQNWILLYEGVTSNPLVLDNAPGGIIPPESNPLVSANDIMDFQLPGAPAIDENALFAFTPTVLTHDILNYNSFAEGHAGYLNFDFKLKDLNYDNETAVGDQNSSSNDIGYPHLGYPNTHYSVTPFDALYTWDENTVHISNGRKSPSYYAQEPSPMQGHVKNWLLEESEFWNLYLQNKQIGASYLSYPYRVDYIADNEMWWGEHVTQKTDFKELTVESNAIVEAQAGEAHYLLPGTWMKYGSEAHIFIAPDICFPTGGKSSDRQPNLPKFREGSAQNDNPSLQSDEMRLIPNPTHHSFSIGFPENSKNKVFDFYIYDLSGNLLLQGTSDVEHTIALNLAKGMYVVRVKSLGKWYVEKLIIE